MFRGGNAERVQCFQIDYFDRLNLAAEETFANTLEPCGSIGNEIPCLCRVWRFAVVVFLTQPCRNRMRDRAGRIDQCDRRPQNRGDVILEQRIMSASQN